LPAEVSWSGEEESAFPFSNCDNDRDERRRRARNAGTRGNFLRQVKESLCSSDTDSEASQKKEIDSDADDVGEASRISGRNSADCTN
jgi:hypothetical protein